MARIALALSTRCSMRSRTATSDRVLDWISACSRVLTAPLVCLLHSAHSSFHADSARLLRAAHRRTQRRKLVVEQRRLSTSRRGTRETARRMRLPPSERTGPENTHAFVSELLGEDVHMTRVMSLANGVVGVLHAAALGIHAIGRGLADALDLDPKHAVKQVDRLLSNTGIKIWDWFTQWVTYVVASRKEILVALDWTEFDKDGHSTIALYLVSSHGRATPLIWKTVAFAPRAAAASSVQSLSSRAAMSRGVAAPPSPSAAASFAVPSARSSRAGSAWKELCALCNKQTRGSVSTQRRPSPYPRIRPGPARTGGEER